MTRPSDIILSHRDLDLAIAGLTRAMQQVERGLSARVAALPEALDRLAEAMLKHFRVEDDLCTAASDLFGQGIPETDALTAKREELWGTTASLFDAPSDAAILRRLRRQFIEYTDLEWRFLRNYSGLIRPGTASA